MECLLFSENFKYNSLRLLKAEDAHRMLDWMHLRETKDFFLKDFAAPTLEDVSKFIDMANASESEIHLAVVDAEDAYLGTISLKSIVPGFSAEYAISMCKEARGTGAAAKATRDILELAFGRLGLHRIYLNVRADNTRAIRFYEKLGFVYEGMSRDGICLDGRYIDLLWFSMLKTDHEEDVSSASEQ